MQFTTADIHLAEDFSGKLKKACQEMLAGKPTSRALADNDISQSTFKTLIRGLRKSAPVINPEELDLRHPAWQDDLVSDLWDVETVYVPTDFEEALERIEAAEFNDEEKQIIYFCYKDRLSLGETAEKLGIGEPTASMKKSSALSKLRSHKDELVLGLEYTDSMKQLRALYDSHQQELSWMQEGISYLKEMDADFAENETVDERTKAFFKEVGVRKLSDLIGIRPVSLLMRIVTDAYGYVEELKVPDDEQLIYPDTELKDLDFSTKTITAFHNVGLETVGDVLELDENEAAGIPGVGVKQLTHLCWLILGDTNGPENRENP